MYTDSQNAIDSFNFYRSGEKNWSKVLCIDLWIQCKNYNRSITLLKVKGHSKDKMNEYVDYLADLSHNYKKSNLKLLSKDGTKRRAPNDISHYRIYDIIYNYINKTLDMDKLENKLKLLELELDKWNKIQLQDEVEQEALMECG